MLVLIQIVALKRRSCHINTVNIVNTTRLHRQDCFVDAVNLVSTTECIPNKTAQISSEKFLHNMDNNHTKTYNSKQTNHI